MCDSDKLGQVLEPGTMRKWVLFDVRSENVQNRKRQKKTPKQILRNIWMAP